MRIFAQLALVGTLLLTGSATAQEQAALPRIALTEAPSEDPVYDLMGEYVGPVSVGENKYEPLGLQIRPIGDDRFEALQYKGGLPGQKTFSLEPPVSLVGQRSGEFVVLSGGPWAIFVERDHCLILDREGKKVGRLERIWRGSPTMGAEAPKGATVLFDGTNTEQFTNAKMTEDGLLMEGANTLPMFQDFDMHVEFRLPYMPNSDGQKRGNSGCYLQSRYEVQVLDSFAQLPQFNGCSSLYRTKAPDLNMCYPPLRWQTYDIHFTSPRWGSNGKKLRNARITVWQNGVKTQDDVELMNKTGAGKPEEPNLLPHIFQNHSDPVRYRNIWVVDRGLTHADFPVFAKPVQAVKAKKKSPKASKPAEKKKPSTASKKLGNDVVPAAKKQSEPPKAPEPPTPPQPKKAKKKASSKVTVAEPAKKSATDAGNATEKTEKAKPDKKSESEPAKAGK